jgi:hypothetical protein
MAVLPDDPDSVAIAAPAKLNLSLAILARRSDGYHEIESLMVPVSLADRLVVRAVDAPGVRLRVRFGGRLAQPAGAVLCRDVPADDSNLVVRAARRLAEAAGIERGLDVDPGFLRFERHDGRDALQAIAWTDLADQDVHGERSIVARSG